MAWFLYDNDLRHERVKEFLLQIFCLGRRVCYISCQKRFCKTKYGFEGLISNIDLGQMAN